MARLNPILLSLVVLISTPISAAEKAMKDKEVIKESLLDASPTSVRYSASLIRDGMDRADPGGMYGYVTAIKLLIQHALALSEQESEKNAELAVQYKQAIMPATYNLAADTWTGWEDANEAAEPFQPIGFEAARLNLKLSQEIEQPASKQLNGYWIVGVHLLAAGQYDDAKSSFAACRDLARQADEATTAIMATGWVHVANILAGSDESSELGAVKSQLASIGKEGAFYAAQYEPALAKFQR